MNFSVVVPVYNNQRSLKQIHQNISKSFSSFNYSYQIVFVDDSSDDLSFDTLRQLKDTDPAISILQLQKNYSQPVAILAGLEYAVGNYIIILSADLQEEELFIDKLISATAKFPDSDLFVGYRNKNSDYFIYKFLSRLFYKIIQLKIPKMPLGGFDTGIISSDLKQKFIRSYYDGIFIQGTLVQLANKVECIEYHRKKGAATTFRVKSIYFKLNYFLICVASVYFPSAKEAVSQNASFYLIKKYLP